MATKKAGDAKKPAPAPAANKAGAKVGDLDGQFEAAAERAKKLKERPDNDTLLRLYALYKQGSEGDVKGEKPGFFDFVGAAKYEAWAKLKGTGSEAAKKKYVDLVAKLGG
jgi:acyl-CoA-binding protein